MPARYRRFPNLNAALTYIGYRESPVRFSGKMIGNAADVEVSPFVMLLRPALDEFAALRCRSPAVVEGRSPVEQVTFDVSRSAGYVEYRSSQILEKVMRPLWSVHFMSASSERKASTRDFLTVAMTPLAPGQEGHPCLIFVASSSMDAMTRFTTIGRLAT